MTKRKRAQAITMIHLCCPSCLANNKHEGFHVRGQFCSCGWRREAKQCATGCDAPPHQPSKVLCEKCLAVLDRKMRTTLGFGVTQADTEEPTNE